MQENLDNSPLDYLQSSETIDQDPLILALPAQNIPVSGLSSILRSIQATVRTVIDDQKSNTTLRLIIKDAQVQEKLEFRLAFIPLTKTNDSGYAAEVVFEHFFESLIIAARKSSQRTLFGEKVMRSNRSVTDVSSILLERIHEMINELSRFKNITLSYRSKSLSFNHGMVKILD
tara:strand:- start:315 stop:836 length:522 start_codon:yes stop_codon:yes gene_type:complete